MRRGIAVAIGVALVAACTSRPATQLSSTASVAVDGNATNFHVVKCSQLDWRRTIEIGSTFAGAKVVVDEQGEPASAESVHIDNLNGFTGRYARGGDGKADLSITGDKISITGTANGYRTDKPGDPVSATFKITATC
ncbi:MULTISPECIES: lipoprotein LpqH [unclassified Mycobacterium]|uniref:lipoprotein LpqH n=1 Tax=unclassified Mycobacterium TaxID=2642494 RepID=UPI000A8A35E6|nr:MULTISPECIES: lipoprotein LpqH [unclassified Mycobacterium]